MIGYAFCGSFCTLRDSLSALKELINLGFEIQPIMSEKVYSTDTRFFEAKKLREEVEGLCGREIIHSIERAEPLGPKTPLEALIIAPCTGNTLAKLSAGITDSSVTMAAKAHLRCDRPLLIALATNDAMSGNLSNIAKLLTRRQIYFVPLRQDDPKGKPYSLVADMKRLPEAFAAMGEEKQLRPLFLEP